MSSSDFFVKATISDFRKFLASHDVFGDNVVNTSSIEFEVFDPHYEVSTVFNSPCAISNFNKLNNDFSDESIVTLNRGHFDVLSISDATKFVKVSFNELHDDRDPSLSFRKDFDSSLIRVYQAWFYQDPLLLKIIK